jgi:ABC-type lipoprotein release transport system permease subunit
MSRVVLAGRLAARDLRRRPGQAALLLLAIATATTTLTVGLALRGATDKPYQDTRATTAGPDVVAGMAPRPGNPVDPAELRRLAGEQGVTDSSGPFPYTQKTVTVGGLSVTAWLQGRDSVSAPVDRPALTAGEWAGPGGAVLEAGFAKALGARTGDRVEVGDRRFTVTGLAVTAASGQYPKVCFAPCWGGAATPLPPSGPAAIDPGPSPFTIGPAGLLWLTEADTRAVAGPDALGYLLNLRLADPDAAPRFAAGHVTGSGDFTLSTWQDVLDMDSWLMEANQFSLLLGSWLLSLIALASIVVLVGTRMADQTRRVGLLKAVGATPELIAAVLLVEHLAIAVLSSLAGLAAGRLLVPVLTTPSAGMLGRPDPAPFTPTMIVLVMGAALAISAAATFVPAVRAARTSTAQALAGTVRPPRRRPRLIALSARLPVPLLLGLRIAARRPRRTWLGVFAVAVTTTGITAALATRSHRFEEAAPGLDPRLAMTQGLMVITVMLAVQAAVNTVCLVWATTLDTRQPAALARALGATPAQITAGLSAAQVLPALAGALLGMVAGLGLAQALDDDPLTVPPLWQLTAVLLGTVLVIMASTALPARIGAARPAGPALDAPRS